ncbi:MAG: sigma 54-interacting transcriptional regulator, partial [Candidatus Cloacimonadota bacterium]|nr:sigma 54-interacting transcriptional regulator [Candidatus Cloacimonadota bacterium]
VLIEGETGTGKEVVASTLYWLSPRAGKPYISINASAIQESLELSELFGHKKGAFTGADKNKMGVFEKANKGILFLDEIADLNQSAQARILRAIEQNEIQILGGDTKTIDTRFIFASNSVLQDLVKKQKFRKDLFFRINRNRIVLPPLRERGDDIVLLVKYFIKKSNKSANININYDTINKILLEYHWPGNVRELKNFINNLLIKYDTIDNSVIKKEIANFDGNLFEPKNNFEELSFLMELDNFDEAHQDFQRMYIIEQLRRNKFKINLTSENIGVNRMRLYRLMKKLQIKIEDINY